MRRTILTDLITWKAKKDRNPLILKGAGQVGKTHILCELGTTQFKRYHYLNFEEQPELQTIFEADLNPLRIITELSFVFKTHSR